MRRPLGCLTGTALIAAMLATLLLVGFVVATGNGIFSPGHLAATSRSEVLGGATSHADLEARCEACHAQPLGSLRMADKCLACHTAVKEELAKGDGFHGRFSTTDECRACHTDHGGTDGTLTLADPTGFPHEKTGFSLVAHPVNGSGASFHCADCHTQTVTKFVPQTCETCHAEKDQPFMTAHVEAFGLGCRACHDGIDTYGKDFTHETWPLAGKHAEATCVACHKGATTPEALRATETTCAGCHARDDVHEGRLGSACADCHNPSTWTEAAFDHNVTRFKLTGKHMQVECLQCHVNRQWTGLGLTCEACHSVDDPHDGQFAQSCSSCHTTTGWQDVTFDHSTTRFKLAGAHARTDCVKCHVNGKYKDTPMTCVACHKADDAHKGSLGTDCARCHRVTAWQDVTFDHNQTRFKLTGAHTDTACRACHVGGIFKGTPSTCYACHKGDDKHAGAYGTSCGSCHATKTWSGATFDHATTGFPLVASHRSVACRACHVGGIYRGTPKTCYACHKADDAHDGSMGTNCAACHRPTDWDDVTFNHANTDFPLTGAHRSVACASCHRNNTYTGTPTACSACHTKPTTHQPSAFSGCQACHSTVAWTPATFNATHTFPMTHRNAGGVCTKCHTGSWAVYSCARCHSDSSMTREHSGISGFTLTTCARCHPRGG